MLDGWTMPASYGSTWTRPASISLRMSPSLSSTSCNPTRSSTLVAALQVVDGRGLFLRDSRQAGVPIEAGQTVLDLHLRLAELFLGGQHLLIDVLAELFSISDSTVS